MTFGSVRPNMQASTCALRVTAAVLSSPRDRCGFRWCLNHCLLLRTSQDQGSYGLCSSVEWSKNQDPESTTSSKTYHTYPKTWLECHEFKTPVGFLELQALHVLGDPSEFATFVQAWQHRKAIAEAKAKAEELAKIEAARLAAAAAAAAPSPGGTLPKATWICDSLFFTLWKATVIVRLCPARNRCQHFIYFMCFIYLGSASNTTALEIASKKFELKSGSPSYTTCRVMMSVVNKAYCAWDTLQKPVIPLVLVPQRGNHFSFNLNYKQ